MGGEVGAGGEFGEDAGVVFGNFVVIEDVGKVGACEAALAVEKRGSESREVVDAVALIPPAFRSGGFNTELLIEVFPHHQSETLAVLVGGCVREAVKFFHRLNPFLFYGEVCCNIFTVSLLWMG